MQLAIVRAAPAGIYITFAIALYFWHVAASLLGVAIAVRLGLGDSDFALKADLKKMSLCSLIALAIFFPLFYFAQSPVVFMIYVLCFFFSLKVAYLGANHGFLLAILGAAMAGMIDFVPVVRLLKLRGVFFLYLLFLIAFLIRRQMVKKGTLELKKTEQLKEQQVRSQARRDPNFTTFCFQCLFYRLDIHRCRLRLDGKEVHEIKLDQRTFCTSFQQAPPGRPV